MYVPDVCVYVCMDVCPGDMMVGKLHAAMVAMVRLAYLGTFEGGCCCCCCFWPPFVVDWTDEQQWADEELVRLLSLLIDSMSGDE